MEFFVLKWFGVISNKDFLLNSAIFILLIFTSALIYCIV